MAHADTDSRKHSAAPLPHSSSERRWRAPGFSSIELLRGSRITTEYPRHWHDEVYLSATLSGTSHLDCLGSSLHTRPGTLAIVAPGEVHANRKIACNFRCAFIEFHALRTALEQFIERSIHAFAFRSGLVEDQHTLGSFLRVHQSLEDFEPGLQTDHSALSFFHQLAVRHGTADIPLARDGDEGLAVRRTRLFLDEHYADRVSLHQLASLTGLSAYHLNRSFRRKVGIPPHEYQLQVRLMKAKSFLRLGRSISETASLVGFVDQSHFSRHFKRCLGVTPGKFLR